MLKERKSGNIISKIIKHFFLISHGIPYVMAVILMILAGSVFVKNAALNRIIYIAFLSPLIAAIYVISYFYSKKEKKQYWFNMIDIRRISWKVFLFILFFPIGIRWLASVIVGQFVVSGFQFEFSAEMTLNYAIMLLLFGPIPEEIGWRGVALPALQKRYGFRLGILFLGMMWAVWHLPLFFFRETYQFQLGLLTPLFWNYMLGVFFTSIILAVLFNATKQSILAVILFHYLDNLTGEAFIISNSAKIFSTVILGIIAFWLFVFYRGRQGNFSQSKNYKN